MRSILVVLFTFFAAGAIAQPLIPFEFTSEEDNKLIKENDSLKYFAATDDTAHIVALNEETSYYKLLTRERKTVVAEGAFVVEGEKYIQEGKWTQYYESGRIKVSGYYQKGKPIGTWQEFFSTGKVKTVYNYGIFLDKGELSTGLSGTYQEFYQSGKIKVNGFYSSNAVTYYDTLLVNDPVSNTDIRKAVRHRTLNAAKIGHWEYFAEDGELEKKEDF